MIVENNRLIPVRSTGRGGPVASALLVLLFVAACEQEPTKAKEQGAPDFNEAPEETVDPFAGTCLQIFSSPNELGLMVSTDTKSLLSWVETGDIDPDTQLYLPQAATEALVTCDALKMRLPTVAEVAAENKNCDGIMGVSRWTQERVLEGEPPAPVQMYMVVDGAPVDFEADAKVVTRCVLTVGAEPPPPLQRREDPDATSRDPDAGSTDPDADRRGPDAGSTGPDAASDAGATEPDAGPTDPPDAVTEDSAP